MSGHTDEEKRRIEAELPPRFRGRGPGYRRMLQAVDLRVGIDGIRGKSSLTRMVDDALRHRGLTTYAKETGTDPISHHDGTPHPIDRRGEEVTLDETVWEMKRFFPYEAAVVENQAIGGYTMRFFNKRILDPDYLLITNVRRDHQGDIHRTREGIARTFGRSANAGCTVLCGERDPELRRILREHTEARGARFVPAPPPGDYVPGLENLALLDELLGQAFGERLGEARFERARRELEARFRWREAGRPGLFWFPAADANDVDSTEAILQHLRDGRHVSVTFVAYFRPKRRDRTASFVPFFRRHLASGSADRVYLAGAGAKVVKRRLGAFGDRVAVLEDDPDRAPEAVDRVAAESRARHVMTVGNAVPPFPRALRRELAPREAETPGEGGPVTFPVVHRRDRPSKGVSA